MCGTLDQLPRCYVCDVPLGESSKALLVENNWLHYGCAFAKVVSRNNSKAKYRGI